MSYMYLPKGSLLVFSDADGSSPMTTSEHNRTPVNQDPEMIGKSTRMIDATLRKWHIDNKRSISVSWDNLPHSAEHTFDGGAGGQEMIQFFESHPYEFIASIRRPDGSKEDILVMFKSFSHSIEKRGVYETWGIQISLEEV